MPSELGALVDLLMAALRQLTVLPSDPALRLAVYSALALAALTLVGMLNVLVLSELAARRERRRAAFTRLWRPVLIASSMGEQVELPSLPRQRLEEKLWLLLMWANYQRQLRGSTKERLNTLFNHLAMDSFVSALLDSRKVHRRLLALTCLRHMGDESFWVSVAPRVASSNPVESLAAAEALVAMNPSRAMHFLVPLYIERRDWAYFRFKLLCKQAGREAAGPPLLAALKQASPPRIVALLEWVVPSHVAEWARQSLRQTPVSAELSNEQRDAVCASLRCLAELHDPQDRELVVSALDHPLPQVRSEAVVALKRQATIEDESQFTRMLSDPNWWVRQAAADALVALPNIDEPRLNALCEGLQDRYGRDALRRAIAEKR
ncbi:HEAT repeat domain-containing protein [Vreelandella populi]|uniref:HEAT repeat domain-containing protein n=1 Tax=Vreelandella populi TaxID=2498858 RepID=A0A433LDT7_9GAMM|nr:HEAT repeat domain-containing protein [Halomonas populi]RUR35295.1 HEAT repeat domain-containing protein [Halomonas populi]RUR47486.1 HEAT repeat domain-containing protein [Halomonas populi]